MDGDTPHSRLHTEEGSLKMPDPTSNTLHQLQEGETLQWYDGRHSEPQHPQMLRKEESFSAGISPTYCRGLIFTPPRGPYSRFIVFTMITCVRAGFLTKRQAAEEQNRHGKAVGAAGSQFLRSCSAFIPCEGPCYSLLSHKM